MIQSPCLAEVAELVDAHVSEACGSNPLEVRVLSPAQDIEPHGYDLNVSRARFASYKRFCLIISERYMVDATHLRRYNVSMKWSSDFAYVVGLITTDGSLSKDKRHIDFTSKDLDLIKTLARILNLKNRIGKKSSSYGKQKIYYRIQFGNVKLYQFFMSIGLMPNKTKDIGALKIPSEYFCDFLRGHLDGDGFTLSYWDKRWKSSYMFYTGFVSASKKHLEWMHRRIKTLYHIEGILSFSGRSTYQLMFAKKKSIQLLEKLYYSDTISCLKRKRSKIDTSLGIIRNIARVAKLVYAYV